MMAGGCDITAGGYDMMAGGSDMKAGGCDMMTPSASYIFIFQNYKIQK